MRRMRLRRHALALLMAGIALAPLAALGDICKYVDPEGNVHYSNVAPERSWRRVSCTSSEDGEPVRKPTPAPAPPAADGSPPRAAPTPPSFPRVDVQTQKGRDDVRRKVLSDELAAEQKLLAEARGAYADGAPVPLPEERANAEKYRERIARLRQAVALHERNVEALKKELSGTK